MGDPEYQFVSRPYSFPQHCTSYRPEPSGVTGLMGSLLDLIQMTELGLLRAYWIIGSPFLDRKSLATISNVGGVGG